MNDATPGRGKTVAVAAAGGAAVGLLMAALVAKGNPPHMGICGACFARDVAGGLGLHRAAPVQYLRPEILGVVLGAMVAAFSFREWRPRGGASPFFKVLLGAWVTVGALVFLGCPFRMVQRIGGGDLNAVIAAGGLAAGIGIALRMTRAGVSLGRAAPQPAVAGLLLPLALAGLLALLLVKPAFVFSSEKGPGSLRAPWWISLGAAAAAGFLLQRLRFCTLAAFRNALFLRDGVPMAALLGIVAGYGALAASSGRFHLGMQGQPIAHADVFWNVASMALVGLAASLAGGCPARQFVLAGEGDVDAAAVVLGLVLGGAFAHNFGLVSGADGPSAGGKIAVIAGFAFCALAAGFLAPRTEAARA